VSLAAMSGNLVFADDRPIRRTRTNVHRGEEDMARIGNDRVVERGERRPDGSWMFTISYTLHFDPFEIGKAFQDAVKIWEHDPSDDDRITVYGVPETFVATGPSVFRKKRFTASADALDTEIGREEVCAWIWLRGRDSTGPAADEQKTPILVPSINP
jgi:hypothetical protein